MELGLNGKTAIVTGGASNIGRAITLALLGEGTNVVIADLDEEAAGRVVAVGNAGGLAGRAIAVQTDITKPEMVANMVDRAVKEFGGIDVHVNGAGWTFERLFLDKPREEWEKEVNINLWGPVNCFEAVLPRMLERNTGGAFVSLSSDAGRMGEYKEGVYAAAKAGVIALSKTLAREYGKFSLWQGQNFTPDQQEAAAKRYALRRLGKASDIANAVLFLASDAAGYITGQTLSVSGGYTMM